MGNRAEDSHRWTPERDEVLTRMWKDDLPAELIASRMSTTVAAILDRRAAIMLPARQQPTGWSEEQDAILKKRWPEGWSATQIARLLHGKSRNAVIGRVHRLGMSSASRSAGCPRRMTYAPRIKAPKVERSHVRPPKPGPQKKPALVLGRTFVEGPGSEDARAAFRDDGLTMVDRVTIGAGVESPNSRPFAEAWTGCKWPLGERHQVRACCNPIARGAYCAGHATVAYSQGKADLLKPSRIAQAARVLARFDRIDLEPDHRITHGKSPPRPFRDTAGETEWDSGRAAA